MFTNFRDPSTQPGKPYMQFKVSGYYQSTKIPIGSHEWRKPNKKFQPIPNIIFSQSSQFEKTTQITKQINHTQKAIILVIMFENTIPNIIWVKARL